MMAMIRYSPKALDFGTMWGSFLLLEESKLCLLEFTEAELRVSMSVTDRRD